MNTGGYPYAPRADLDRSPDRQGFISNDSFHADDRSQASSYASQPVYQAASHHWRSPEPSHTHTAHISRRHSHDRYGHSTDFQESYNAPQRSLAAFEQGAPSFSGIGSSTCASEEMYNRSQIPPVRRDAHHTSLSLPYDSDYVSTQNMGIYPSSSTTTEIFSVPQSIPSAYAASSTRPIPGRRYSASSQQHQQHQQSSYAPYTQAQHQHQHQESYETYSASSGTGQSHYESAQAPGTPTNYTIGRPEEWQASIHQPIPQVPATSILRSSSSSRTSAHSHHPHRSYPGLQYDESAAIPFHAASMPPTPSQHGFSVKSPVEDVRYSSQSLSGSDEFHNYMEDVEDLRTLDDGSIVEGSGTQSQSKPKRRRADPSQLRVLNEVYARTAFPSTEERVDLGRQLNMTPRQVQIWFQNRRQNAKAGRPPPGSPPTNPRQQSLSTPPVTPVAQFPGYQAMQPKIEGPDPDYTYYQGPMRR
ncbi:hypothetical protein FRB93_009111 [Tulasnella sp. JGI-2019a]|nr:hypothetical protein FRB93_009111 [Tulasnella sp. JGI-2019a]